MYSAYQKGKPGQVGAVRSVSTVGFMSVLVQQDVTLSELTCRWYWWVALLNPLQVFLLGRGGGESSGGRDGRGGCDSGGDRK